MLVRKIPKHDEGMGMAVNKHRLIIESHPDDGLYLWKPPELGWDIVERWGVPALIVSFISVGGEEETPLFVVGTGYVGTPLRIYGEGRQVRVLTDRLHRSFCHGN